MTADLQRNITASDRIHLHKVIKLSISGEKAHYYSLGFMNAVFFFTADLQEEKFGNSCLIKILFGDSKFTNGSVYHINFRPKGFLVIGENSSQIFSVSRTIIRC